MNCLYYAEFLASSLPYLPSQLSPHPMPPNTHPIRPLPHLMRPPRLPMRNPLQRISTRHFLTIIYHMFVFRVGDFLAWIAEMGKIDLLWECPGRTGRRGVFVRGELETD